jgi:hypothetical protein
MTRRQKCPWQRRFYHLETSNPSHVIRHCAVIRPECLGQVSLVQSPTIFFGFEKTAAGSPSEDVLHCERRAVFPPWWPSSFAVWILLRAKTSKLRCAVPDDEAPTAQAARKRRTKPQWADITYHAGPKYQSPCLLPRNMPGRPRRADVGYDLVPGSRILPPLRT